MEEIKRWLIVANSQVVGVMDKEFVKVGDFEGFYDTVVEDPSHTFKVGDTYSLEAWEAVNVPAIDLLKRAKSSKLSEAKELYDAEIKGIGGEFDVTEMTSWGVQEQEARAWVADNNTATPFVDNLLSTREPGETKAELIGKIIAKADGFRAAYPLILGRFHKRNKQVEEATTVEEVNSLTF